MLNGKIACRNDVDGTVLFFDIEGDVTDKGCGIAQEDGNAIFQRKAFFIRDLLLSGGRLSARDA